MLQLAKGGSLQLAKITTDKNLRVGLGWDENKDSTIKDAIDIDVMAIIVNDDGKGVDENLIRFYNNIDGSGKTSSGHYGSMTPEQALKEAAELLKTSVVVISKDNLTGAGDGDDETLLVNSALFVPGKKVVIAINIYEAKARKHLFGMVKNSYCKVYDSTGTVLFNYDLGEDFSLETGVIVGEFYLHNGEPKFKALGEGFEGDMNDLVLKYK